MKKAIIFFVFSIAFFSIQAQTNVDSLVNVLETQEHTPAKQFELYIQIVEEYYHYDTEKTILYSEKGLELAEKEKDKSAAAKLCLYLGLAHYQKADYDTSFLFYEKGLNLAVEIKDKATEAKIYANIGLSYRMLEKYSIALEYFIKSLAISESLGDKDAQAKVLVNIGGIYRALNNPDRALEYLEQAKAIAESLKTPYLLACVYHALGLAYSDKKDYEKRLEYLQMTLEFSRIANDKQYEIISLGSLSLTYSDIYKNYDKALEYARESLKIAEEFGTPRLIVGSWISLAQIYRAQERYEECDVTASKAWELDSTSMEYAAYSALNILYSNVYLGNKDKAVYFLKKYHELNKQHNDKSLHDSLSDMEVKYETEKKEMRIAALEEKERLYIWLGVAGGALLLMAFGVLFFRYRMNVQKRKVIEQQHKIAEQQIKQLEQEKLLVATQAVLDGETAERSRLARDLHDGLGGMLSVIKLNLKDMTGYAVIDNPDATRFHKALEMLDQSIGELRRVAHHLMPESLMRYGLKVSLEDFCRAIPNTHFQYLGENPRLDSRLEVLIYRCAYELVNNAVKYADATSINLQLMIDKGIISLTVQDNGSGFDPEAVSSGMGLENIRARVSPYNGKMTIYSSPGKGTEVSIEMENSYTVLS